MFFNSQRVPGRCLGRPALLFFTGLVLSCPLITDANEVEQADEGHQISRVCARKDANPAMETGYTVPFGGLRKLDLSDSFRGPWHVQSWGPLEAVRGGWLWGRGSVYRLRCPLPLLRCTRALPLLERSWPILAGHRRILMN